MIASFKADISGLLCLPSQIGHDGSPHANTMRYAVARFDAAQRASVLSVLFAMQGAAACCVSWPGAGLLAGETALSSEWLIGRTHPLLARMDEHIFKKAPTLRALKSW